MKCGVIGYGSNCQNTYTVLCGCVKRTVVEIMRWGDVIHKGFQRFSGAASGAQKFQCLRELLLAHNGVSQRRIHTPSDADKTRNFNILDNPIQTA